MAKTISEILLQATPVENTELKKFIDKTIPSGLIETKLDLLTSSKPSALLSLVIANYRLKTLILSEVILVEDMLATGIYKSKYGNIICSEIFEIHNEFFPKDPNCKSKEKFKNKLSSITVSGKKLFDMTLFDVFNSMTLGQKIELVKLMDRGVVSKMLVSVRTKYTKKDLITCLEHARKIRNHVAHNFFIMDEEPWIEMVDANIVKKHNLETNKMIVEYLFSKLDNILKISSRGTILSKLKREIKKDEEINFKEIRCILIS